MKAIFSLMGALCPKIKRTTHIPIGICKPAIATFLLVFSFVFVSQAQEAAVHATPVAKAENRIVPLRIGDRIPEELWNLPLEIINHPDGKETITLNDFRDQKLIVLDFWATWCSPCIASINKLDSIKIALDADEMTVIPVLAFDSENRAKSFAERNNWKRYSVVNDKQLRENVFSRYVTAFGTVWIHDGKVLAIPMYDEITSENIATVLHGSEVSMQNQPIQPIAKP